MHDGRTLTDDNEMYSLLGEAMHIFDDTHKLSIVKTADNSIIERVIKLSWDNKLGGRYNIFCICGLDNVYDCRCRNILFWEYISVYWPNSGKFET